MIRRILFSAAILLAMVPIAQAKAAIIIDDFLIDGTGVWLSNQTVPNSTINAGANSEDVTSARSITKTANRVTLSLGSGNFFASFSGAATLTLAYDFTTPATLNLQSYSLEVPFFNNVGDFSGVTPTVQLTYFGGPGGLTVVPFAPQVITPGQNVYFDLMQPVAAATVDRFELTITTTGASSFGGAGPLQAVPEPASIALLATSCLAGLGAVVARRRKNA